MKKFLFALMFGLIAIQAFAADKYLFHPKIDTQIIQKIDTDTGISYNVIQITISELYNFKDNKFGIRFNLIGPVFNPTGTAIEFEGKSYCITNPNTGKLIKNIRGKHIRRVVKEIIELSVLVPRHLWGKYKSYYSKYFSNYDDNTSDTLVIEIPIAEDYASDVEAMD